MENNLIYLLFLAVLFLLWKILKELIDINLHSEQVSNHLFKIENKLEIENQEDLRGPNLVDLSDIGDHLKELNDKLESIKSDVSVIEAEVIHE